METTKVYTEDISVDAETMEETKSNKVEIGTIKSEDGIITESDVENWNVGAIAPVGPELVYNNITVQ